MRTAFLTLPKSTSHLSNYLRTEDRSEENALSLFCGEQTTATGDTTGARSLWDTEGFVLRDIESNGGHRRNPQFPRTFP